MHVEPGTADPDNSDKPPRRPTLWAVVPDVLAFALGLGTCWKLGWSTTDLVWSLWLCSLVLGYLTILSAIAAGVVFGAAALRQGDVSPGKLPIVILAGLLLAAAFLAFFSFHFCAFHAAHASFLTSFFPLQGLPKNAFAGAFTNPLLLWKTALQTLVPAYGAFLIPAMIAERRYIFAPLIGAIGAARRGIGDSLLQTFMHPEKRQKAIGNPITRPYINVIRMHLLIFFFGFCHAMKIESFAVFATVYAVYFFPWRDFRRMTAPAV